VNQYDTLIRDYFYEHKSVTFEKVGELTLDTNIASPEQPPSKASIHFRYDKRAVTTPALAEYIAGKTGKNKVLINSDLESFVELMRQFMNIGKPYEMEGVGILKLGSKGEYEFAAFDEAHKKEESKAVRKQKAKADSPLAVKSSSNKSILMLFALVIVLGVLGVVGWGTYKLFVENKNNTASQAETANADTTMQDSIQPRYLPDTAIVKTDSLPKQDAGIVSASDSAEYKFIHETTMSAARAYERMRVLKTWGHPSGVDSVKRDTATVYTLYFKYKLNAADTTAIKDSVQKLLNRKVRIKPA